MIREFEIGELANDVAVQFGLIHEGCGGSKYPFAKYGIEAVMSYIV